jgi:Predicted hydrolases or acyltransferases (alpha/beta hydrolase superfamily)
MRIVPLSGITERTVTTNRTTTRVLSSGSGRVPVVFLHDSPASATFWEETMLALPAGYRAIAPDLRGHGLADPDSKISAVNGLSDVAADIIALMEEEGIGWFVAVGHGWGGVRRLAAHDGLCGPAARRRGGQSVLALWPRRRSRAGR